MQPFYTAKEKHESLNFTVAYQFLVLLFSFIVPVMAATRPWRIKQARHTKLSHTVSSHIVSYALQHQLTAKFVFPPSCLDSRPSHQVPLGLKGMYLKMENLDLLCYIPVCRLHQYPYVSDTELRTFRLSPFVQARWRSCLSSLLCSTYTAVPVLLVLVMLAHA